MVYDQQRAQLHFGWESVGIRRQSLKSGWLIARSAIGMENPVFERVMTALGIGGLGARPSACLPSSGIHTRVSACVSTGRTTGGGGFDPTGSSGDAPFMTIWCRMMLVQVNLTRWAPLVRSPNTHRSRLELLNLAKYWSTIQCFGFFGWLCLARLHVTGSPRIESTTDNVPVRRTPRWT